MAETEIVSSSIDLKVDRRLGNNFIRQQELIYYFDSIITLVLARIICIPYIIAAI